jgi:hypothetical protein
VITVTTVTIEALSLLLGGLYQMLLYVGVGGKVIRLDYLLDGLYCLNLRMRASRWKNFALGGP